MTGGFTLGQRDEEAIREAFAGLERPVEVALELGPTSAPVTLIAAGGREIDTSATTRDVVEAVRGLAELVTLEVVERDEPGPWPRTTVGPGLVYQGMPVGYELTTLVQAIVEAGRNAPSLSSRSRERLEAVGCDVSVDVFVTPT